MIRLLGWCVVVAALVAVGWYGRDAVAALDRAPVTVSVAVSAPSAPKAVPSAKAAPKARPAQARPRETADRPERDNVHPGFATQGIGYYDVRQAAGLPY
jgi:hypothetical protein